MSGSCRDLREYQNSDAVMDAFSALVSGKKSGYKTIIERRKEIPKCPGCSKTLSGEEKFCPDCGHKIAVIPQVTKPF